MEKFKNDAEIREHIRVNFRSFCNQFGEPTLKGARTPENGYRVSCKKSTPYYNGVSDCPPFLILKAINKKLGISVKAVVQYRMPSYSANPINERSARHFSVRWLIKQKTVGSGYENADVGDKTLDDLLENVERILGSKAYVVPSEFCDEDFVINETFVTNCAQISTVCVKSIVSLNRRTVILEAPSKPDKEPFFLCGGIGHQGASFSIITNGETFYPITRVTNSTKKVKLRSNFPKVTLDSTKFNQVDKRMIQTAIRIYVEETFK